MTEDDSLLTHPADMTRIEPTVLLTSTRAMVSAAESAGVSPRTVDRLLVEAGLSRERLHEPEAREGVVGVLALWDRLRSEAGDPTLQLRAPTCLPFGSYGVVDYLVDASRTVGQGFQRFAAYFRLISDGVVLTVEDDAAQPYLSLTGRDGRAVPSVYVDYVFAALIGRSRMHIRPEQVLARVEFTRARPDDPRPYETFFRAPVIFGADIDRLCLPRAEWDTPLEHGDDLLVELLDRHAAILANRLPSPRQGIVADVQQTILERLPTSPKAEEVAKELHVSTRTLQRKLTRAGVTFAQVVENVRAELAKDYLSGDTPISEVAFLLGFSEQSSFHRAFRRWTGMAPGRWRSAAT